MTQWPRAAPPGDLKKCLSSAPTNSDYVGQDWGLGISCFQSFPGDSNVHSGLRITLLAGKETVEFSWRIFYHIYSIDKHQGLDLQDPVLISRILESNRRDNRWTASSNTVETCHEAVHTLSRGPIQLSRESLLVESVFQTQAIVLAKLWRKKIQRTFHTPQACGLSAQGSQGMPVPEQGQGGKAGNVWCGRIRGLWRKSSFLFPLKTVTWAGQA